MADRYETLTYSVDDGVGLLTFNRPERRNALDVTMREELRDLIPGIRADRSLCALIMTGAGGAFCAGGDLKALSEEARPAEASRERIALLHTWFPQLTSLEIPVIAAVDGPAYGAGLNLALAADFVLCSTRARFCAVFGRIGLVPDLGGFFLLPRIVGLQKAKELIFTARSVGPEEAVQLGMALAIHEPDDLPAAARQFAGRFREASRDAIGMAKNILNQAPHLDQRVLGDMEAYAQAICISSEYHRQAVQRFLHKQPLAFDWDRMDRESGQE